jgi:toxin-antitoxin system PIN domain toxin
MIALDTNLLLYAYSTAAPEHAAAREFIGQLTNNPEVVLSEFTLAEFYLHLRNPAILAQPLSAPAAVAVIQAYRHHPHWSIIGYPNDSITAHETLWAYAASEQFARRRLFDARTAISLRHNGVTEFATANVKDFQDFGFTRVWNPLLAS